MARRHFPQTITRWIVTANGYGGFTFGTPTTINGRWQDVQELFRTIQGEEVVSKAIVYLESDVGIGDYLALGDLTDEADPTAIENAHQVRMFNKSPDLRAVNYFRKAVL